MDREPPESCLKLELDRISNLPKELIDKILSRLPIREAVRTSVLSSKWRKKSAMLTELSFDERCISTTSHKTLKDVVDHVLLGHIGPIYTFKLSYEAELASGDMDRWILHLSRNGIKDLRVTWKGHQYKIPSCLLSCEDLNALVLSNCLIVTPPTFEGYKNLMLLALTKVRLAQDVFENLILRCPLLGKLILDDCVGFNHLKIDAPNLWYLCVRGMFVDVNLVNTKLTFGSIYLLNNVANDQRLACRSSNNLLKFLVHLPSIQTLHINNFFLKYLAIGVVPGNLPNSLHYLNVLSIRVIFHNVKEILTTLCLLRSSLALRELKIWASKEKQVVVEEVNYASEENINFRFSQLRRVKIIQFSAVKAELEFVRFLLLSSPVLEGMTVKPASANDVVELLKHLVQFRRASAKAEITFDA